MNYDLFYSIRLFIRIGLIGTVISLLSLTLIKKSCSIKEDIVKVLFATTIGILTYGILGGLILLISLD